jgi:hypothetical protein
VSGLAGLVQQVGVGIALGLQYDPVTSVVASAVAAMLVGYPKAPNWRRPAAIAVLVIAWLLGDGARVGATLVGTPAHGSGSWVVLAAWVVVGVSVGYALPAAAGAMSGRHVIRGTGWLAAGAVAFTVAGAVALLAPLLADALARAAGAA